jgi:antirestriction protein ArdC
MSATHTTVRPPAKPRGGKRHEAAERALADVLELFECGNLPERIAETVIARAENDSPSPAWSLLMILAGTSDARGFRQWQKVGRHVKRGARAFYILGPITRKIRETDETTGEETERVIATGFVGIPVFRYEDTEGDELERPDYRPATFPPLYDVAQRLGVSVEYLPFTDRYRGFYQPGRDRIVLCSHDERVFFHELAHAAHKRVNRSLKGGQVASQEIVAETVAATLCRLHGLDGYVYSGAQYVRGYANGKNPATAAMRVLGDVQKLLALILGGDQ